MCDVCACCSAMVWDMKQQRKSRHCRRGFENRKGGLQTGFLERTYRCTPPTSSQQNIHRYTVTLLHTTQTTPVFPLSPTPASAYILSVQATFGALIRCSGNCFSSPLSMNALSSSSSSSYQDGRAGAAAGELFA